MTVPAWSLTGAPRNRGDARVESELRRRIRAAGRITFREFMEVALYLPQGGYYQRHVEIGRAGDFLTSPEVHPLFGALLARLAARLWQALESPPVFRFIEYGAGTGALCQQLLAAASEMDPDFAAALRYEIIERSAFLRARQEERLAEAQGRVRWVEPNDPVTPAVGCVFSNEVPDALPVHRVLFGPDAPCELYVGLAADRYLELRGPLSQPGLAEYLAGAQSQVPPGSVLEVNLAAGEWLQDVSRRLTRGYAITIDFGGEAEELLRAATPRGGLKCFYRHGWSDDPFDRPGLQDLTAPVDFTYLRAMGDRLGLTARVQTTQGDLLSSLGLRSLLRRVEVGELGSEERQLNVSAIEALAASGALGGHRVLIQSKDAPDPPIPEHEAPSGPLPLLRKPRVGWPQ